MSVFLTRRKQSAIAEGKGDSMATFLHRTTKQLSPDDGTGDLGPAYIRNPDLSLVGAEPVKYWVIEGDAVRAATAFERTSIDLAITQAEADAAVTRLTAQRDAAVAALNAVRDDAMMSLRAAAEVIRSEFNKQKQWNADTKTKVAGAATFAAFKTAWATLNNTSQITKPQMRTAIRNEISNGNADS